MRDHFLFNDQADQSEPMLILEVGSGHGKFAYLVVKHLLEMREFLPTLSAPSTSTATGSDTGGSPAHHTTTATTAEGVAEVPEDADRENETVDTTEGSTRETVLDGSEGNGTLHKTTSDAARGGQDWDGRVGGEFDGLPFRYVVTDVAQVCIFCNSRAWYADLLGFFVNYNGVETNGRGGSEPGECFGLLWSRQCVSPSCLEKKILMCELLNIVFLC